MHSKMLTFFKVARIKSLVRRALYTSFIPQPQAMGCSNYVDEVGLLAKSNFMAYMQINMLFGKLTVHITLNTLSS